MPKNRNSIFILTQFNYITLSCYAKFMRYDFHSSCNNHIFPLFIQKRIVNSFMDLLPKRGMVILRPFLVNMDQSPLTPTKCKMGL